MSTYRPDIPREDDALAELHKEKTLSTHVTMNDAVYKKQEENFRKRKLYWKNIFYLVVLIIILLPFIAMYLSHFLQNAFGK